MQKLITVSVDTQKLLNTSGTVFSVNEVDSVNDLLEQGWEIDDWDILVENTDEGQLLLLVTLNDDAMFDEDDMDDEFDFDDDDEDEDEEDDTEFEEDDKVKRL